MDRKVLSPDTRIEGTRDRVVDFWRWAYSDIAQNITRGPFAEYLVAKALGLDTESEPRDPWAEADLVLTLPGKRYRIEVKSTASFQAWKARRGRKRRRATGFAVKFAKVAYTLDGGARKARRSHVYVLAFDNVEDEEDLRNLDATRWDFWVLSRRELTSLLGAPIGELVGRSKSISFKRLEEAGFHSVKIQDLGTAILAKCPSR